MLVMPFKYLTVNHSCSMFVYKKIPREIRYESIHNCETYLHLISLPLALLKNAKKE